MLIDLCRELGLNYDPYDYDGVVSDESVQQDDEIDEIAVAGCISNKKLLEAAKAIDVQILFATMALLVHGFDPIVVSEPSAKYLTREVMVGTLTKLVAWGILAEITNLHTAVFCTCAMFLVQKAGKKMRLIFDGRPLNKNLAQPPPVCLPSITDVLKKLAERGSAYMFLGDYRHYFHQFSLPNDVRHYFCVRTKHRWFSCLTLPMGISWAPFISQCASWIMLCYHQQGARKIFVYQGTQERLGTYADVIDRNGVSRGFATFVYDNLFISIDKDCPKEIYAVLMKDITKHLEGNAKHFGAVFKELFLHHHTGKFDLLNQKRDRAGKPIPAVLPNEEGFLPIYLGVEIDIFSSPMRWRHAPKFVRKVLAILGSSEILENYSCDTPRKIATIVGLVVWDSIVSFTSLAEVRPLINILKSVVPLIMRKKDWDKTCFVPNRKWKDSAHIALQHMAKNSWIHMPVKDHTFSVFAASDASDTVGAGIILLGHRLSKLWSFSYPELKERHIFIKEAKAILRCIKFVLHKFPQTNFELKLACDNIPLRLAFQKGYSTNVHVDKIIRRATFLTKGRGVTLTIMDICTTKNVADCLTKSVGHDHSVCKVCLDRYDATWQVLLGLQPPRESYRCTPKISHENLAWIKDVFQVCPKQPSADWHETLVRRCQEDVYLVD